MIDPKELRLENLLWLPGINRFVKVSAIFKTHFRCQDFDGISFDESIRVNYQPVELTPDILEAAGFDSENYMFIKDVFDSRIAICYDYGDRQCGVGFSQRHMFWTNCKHLHQLQNLYWCLCGQELQIDITKLNKEK